MIISIFKLWFSTGAIKNCWLQSKSFYIYFFAAIFRPWEEQLLYRSHGKVLSPFVSRCTHRLSNYLHMCAFTWWSQRLRARQASKVCHGGSLLKRTATYAPRCRHAAGRLLARAPGLPYTSCFTKANDECSRSLLHDSPSGIMSAMMIAQALVTP